MAGGTTPPLRPNDPSMLLRRFHPFTTTLAHADPPEGPGIYRTHILRAFLQRMGKHPSARILDLGTTCGHNLEFLSRQGYKVFAEDLLANLRSPGAAWGQARNAKKGKLGIQMPAIQPFPHPDDHFQGVLCWDVFDFLEREEAVLLARQIHRMMAPGGLALAFFNSRKTESPEPLYRYRIEGPDRMEYSCTGDKRLIRYSYQNRDIMQILANFQVEAFYYLRHRMREVLVEKPRRGDKTGNPSPRKASAEKVAAKPAIQGSSLPTR